MNLYNTIYQLVCDNDCVIIPGFGGFVTNRFPADVDFSKQEFYPPSRKVAFNENLSLSDGLLLNYISQTEDVSWADAEQIVKSFVDELNEKLSDGKTLTFDDLGSFSRRTGSLVFVPNTANLLDEAFGLATFNFPMLPSVSKPRIESAIIKGIPDKNGKKNRRGRAIAWSLSAVAVIAGLVCMSLYMGWFDRLFGNGDDNTMLAGFGVSANNEQVAEATEEAIADEQTASTFCVYCGGLRWLPYRGHRPSDGRWRRHRDWASRRGRGRQDAGQDCSCQTVGHRAHGSQSPHAA